MKKFLLIAVAAIGLLATACTKDETAPVAQEEMSAVTFTVAGPEMGTRATYGDGYTATHLTWGVYDADGKYLEDLSAEGAVGVDFPAGSLSTTVKIDLVNGKEYKVIFWAGAEGAPYAVDFAKKKMTVSGTLVANAEAYDAFYKYEEIETVAGPRTETIELTRPFAQLNIATADTEKAAQGGLDVVNTQVVVKTYNTLDLVNGDVSGDTTHTYKFAAIPADNATGYNKTIEAGGNTYDLLSMNYILVNAKELETVKFTVKSGAFEKEYTYENVPLQRNYKTNIVGNLLTSTLDFNITIDPIFADEEYDVEIVTVSSAQDLAAAIEDLNNDTGSEPEVNITLTGDINLNDLFGTSASTRAGETTSVTLAAGRKLTLDLNNFKLTGTDNTAKNYGLIQNNGDLTIVGPGTIETIATINSGWNRYSAVVSNNPGAVLTVENGAVLEHKGGTDMAYGIDNLTNGTIGDVKATINGATIKSTYRAVRQFLNSDSKKNELIIKAGSVIEGAENNYGVFFHDPSTKANNGTLIIEQGAQVQGVYLFVTAGSTEWPVEFSIAASSITGEKGVVSANVPAGLAVGLVDGVYTKVEIDTEAYVANIGAQGYETLQAAIEAVQEGETISLTKDLVFTEGINNNGISYTDNKSFTLDLKGKTVTSDLGNIALRFKIGEGNEVTNAEVTINIVNGKIVSGDNNWCAISAAVADNSSNKLTLNLENLDVENNKAGDYAVKAWAGAVVNAENVDITSSYGGGFYAVGGELVLDNCTVNQKGMHTAPYMSMAVAVSGKGKATVNSGTYTTEPSAASDGYNQGTSHGSWAAGVMNSGGELIINGGTFANGNVGDDALATAARGLIFGDTGSKIVINDGVFNALKNIIDYQNNLGAQPNPYIVINGGDFSADPTAVTSYGGVVVAEGKVAVQQSNGRWTLVDGVATAEALVEAVAAGGDVVLGADITVSEPVVIEGKTVVLDLNGKTLTAPATSALVANTSAELTVKNGKVIAYESTVRAIGGKATIESGEYTSTGTAVDTPATYRYSIDSREGGEIIINGGNFKSNNGMINVGSTVTINGGKFENIVEKTMTRHLAYVSATLTINGGEFYGKANSSAGGCFFCGAASTCNIQVNGGKFTSLWTSGSVNRIFESYASGSSINVTGGLFNTNGGIASFVTENTDEATKGAYPYIAK